LLRSAWQGGYTL